MLTLNNLDAGRPNFRGGPFIRMRSFVLAWQIVPNVTRLTGDNIESLARYHR
jgi:hypothetical protein